MRSRTLREGSVGLLVLVGIALFGGLILWIRGLDLGRRSYRLTVTFPDVSGMQIGSPVRLRGAAVGKVRDILPSPTAALVEVEISSATVLIPRNSTFQSNQTGLIGETTIDITPKTDLPTTVATNPLAADCAGSLIVCNGDRVQGEIGVSFYALIGATVELATLFADPKLFQNIQRLTVNTSNAAAGVADLTKRVSDLTGTVQTELKTLSNSANRTTTAAGEAATQIGLTAAEVNRLLASNRSSLTNTLNNISLTSDELRRVAVGLAPMLEQGEFITNLQTLSANAAAASANLRSISESLGSEDNILLLQQTLDSARATFQNAQKITADLDELTGDPAFRRNLRNLIDGLNNLVSSTYQLQQQTAIAQVLAPDHAVATRPLPNPFGSAISPETPTAAIANRVQVPSTHPLSSLPPTPPVFRLSQDPHLRLRLYQAPLPALTEEATPAQSSQN